MASGSSGHNWLRNVSHCGAGVSGTYLNGTDTTLKYLGSCRYSTRLVTCRSPFRKLTTSSAGGASGTASVHDGVSVSRSSSVRARTAVRTLLTLAGVGAQGFTLLVSSSAKTACSVRKKTCDRTHSVSTWLQCVLRHAQNSCRRLRSWYDSPSSSRWVQVSLRIWRATSMGRLGGGRTTAVGEGSRSLFAIVSSQFPSLPPPRRRRLLRQPQEAGRPGSTLGALR